MVGVPRSLGDLDEGSLGIEGEELVDARIVGFVLEHELELRSRNSLSGKKKHGRFIPYFSATLFFFSFWLDVKL